MGMFSPLPRPFLEHFTEGEVFMLRDIKVVQIPTTAYGLRDAVEMSIVTADDDDKSGVFSMFGVGVVAQANRMEPGDLPAKVRIERVPSAKPGNNPVKLIVPEGAPTPTVAAADDDDIPF